MKLPGYCTSCHKFKHVRVSNASIVKAQAKGSNIFEGICDACQQAEDDAKRAWQMENLRLAREIFRRTGGEGGDFQ